MSLSLPLGFELLRDLPRAPSDPQRRPVRAIVRSAARERLVRAGIADPIALARGPHVAGSLPGGRAPHPIVRFEGEEWVLKSYRRGGLLARWRGTRYWGARRFLRELDAAAHAERQGVPCPEVLALLLWERGLGSVEAWQVVRYVGGARPLADCVGSPGDRLIFREAGSVVRRMHRAGIDHPDLHISNLVVAPEGNGFRCLVVDWDLARRRAEGTWNPLANLHRLWRSVRKRGLAQRIRLDLGGDGDGAPVRRACLAFLRGYFERDRALLEKARRTFVLRAPLLAVRSRFWRWMR